METFANNWSAQLLMATCVIVISLSVPYLTLIAARHEPRIPATERFAIAHSILFYGALGCFFLSVIDIFFWKTLFIMFIAPAVAALVCVGVAGYLAWVIKRKYGLTIHINNG